MQANGHENLCTLSERIKSNTSPRRPLEGVMAQRRALTQQ